MRRYSALQGGRLETLADRAHRNAGCCSSCSRRSRSSSSSVAFRVRLRVRPLSHAFASAPRFPVSGLRPATHHRAPAHRVSSPPHTASVQAEPRVGRSSGEMATAAVLVLLMASALAGAAVGSDIVHHDDEAPKIPGCSTTTTRHPRSPAAPTISSWLGMVEKARMHLSLTGNVSQSDPAEWQRLHEVESHQNRCMDARKIGDWKSALREADQPLRMERTPLSCYLP